MPPIAPTDKPPPVSGVDVGVGVEEDVVEGEMTAGVVDLRIVEVRVAVFVRAGAVVLVAGAFVVCCVVSGGSIFFFFLGRGMSSKIYTARMGEGMRDGEVMRE